MKLELGTDRADSCPVYVQLAAGKSVARNGNYREIQQRTTAHKVTS